MSNQEEELKNIVVAEKPELNFIAESGDMLRILSEEDEEYLEGQYDKMINFMRSNHGQNYDDVTKDKLYGDLQIMWNEVSGKDGGKLNDINFNLVLHREEYSFIVDLIKNKLEYDVDTVFYAIELHKMIEKMIAIEKFKDDNEIKSFEMTAVDIHYLYHILSKYVAKGLNKKTFLFAEVIRRIALSSNVFNYYKERFNNLSKAIQFWIYTLDKGVAIDKNDRVYQLIWGDDSDAKPNISKKVKIVTEVKKED